MKTFWMRWYGGTDFDPRPIKYPTPIEWWCTGSTPSGRNTICALVQAETPHKAWKLVREYWPEAKGDTCDEKEDGWRPPSCRFPPKEKSR